MYYSYCASDEGQSVIRGLARDISGRLRAEYGQR